MTIYEIKDAYLNCIRELVDPETGEVTEELDIERLAALEDAYDDKLDSIGAWVKDLTAEAKALKEEEQNLAKRRKALEARADNLRGYLSIACDGRKGGGVRAKVSFRAGEFLRIPTSIKRIPEQFIVLKQTITKEADKEAIKAAIKNGVSVPGCRLDLWSPTIR